jgi:hypothetical protein
MSIPKEGLAPMFKKKNIADRVAGELRGKNGKKPTMVLKETHFKKLGLI